MLGDVETRVAHGAVPDQSLAEFKGAVDELRLRLWAILGAGSANDYRGFQEQFRLRRARGICRAIEHDLRQGALCPRHDELAALAAAADARPGLG
ncbi:MAG TPA: hypothetical protein VJQ44_01555 [Gemmatimonadales bacterium]|nr:hypothetical protein [Gemmatimonadales bacterium]